MILSLFWYKIYGNKERFNESLIILEFYSEIVYGVITFFNFGLHSQIQ